MKRRKKSRKKGRSEKVKYKGIRDREDGQGRKRKE